MLGWAAAAALLLAYALVTRDPAAAAGRRYVVLTLAGAAGLAANGAIHAAWPSTALNLLWLALALLSLRRGRAAVRAADPAESPDAADDAAPGPR